MKSMTTQCHEHPDYLDALTIADGSAEPLPPPAAKCETCSTNFACFIGTRDMLRWRDGADELPLPDDWQREVWLRVAETDKGAGSSPNILRFPQADVAQIGDVSPEGTEPPRSVRRRWNHLWWTVAACVAGGLLASVMIAEDDRQTMPEEALTSSSQQGKARPMPSGARSVNVALHAYSLGNEKVGTLRTGARVEQGERLSFDYLNAPSSVGEAMRYLTVVAVQQTEKPKGENVQLVTLMRSRRIGPTNILQPREINTDVRIDAPAGNMTIYGVFSREPVARSAIENAVLGDSNLPGVHFSQLILEVNRGR